MFNTYLKTYFSGLLVVFAIVGLLNLTIDPLWYGQGNRITGVNPPWNERVTKTNLFLRTRDQYDCLLLGTSRATIFNTKFLQNNHCFNYAFSGGKLEELVNYAEYVSQKSQKIQTVYVEIEPASLNRRSQKRSFAEVIEPMPFYQPYFFSFNTVWLSLRTLTNLYSYARLYDRNFQIELAKEIPTYKPKFSVENENNQGCDLDRVQRYQQLQAVFPNAKIVGFVAPMSAWRVYSSRYANDLLNCQLQGIHQIAQSWAAVYDFAVPSALTTQTNNTYDGNHYYPEVFQQIAATVEQRQSDFGIKVNDYAIAAYEKLYADRIQSFLTQVGESERWQG